MVATVLLSMMILGILQVLVGSYRLSAKARYNDHARYIIKSFADQFLTQQTTYPPGSPLAGSVIPFFVPTSQTGVGLTWVSTAPSGSQTTYTGNTLSATSAANPPGPGLQVPLADTNTGEKPIWATVSYQVWNIDPSTGQPSAPITEAAGALLRADFTVTFQMNGRTISQTISAMRATP
jgi:type II secretory pathway pseudopilin PulG